MEFKGLFVLPTLNVHPTKRSTLGQTQIGYISFGGSTMSWNNLFRPLTTSRQ